MGTCHATHKAAGTCHARVHLTCVQAPLPKNWEIYKDEEGSPFYFNSVTKATQYRHPADDYFLRKIAEERQRHLLCRCVRVAV